MKQETSLIVKTDEDLKSMIVEEQNKRQMLTEYIQKNLIDGVDFGVINIKGKESKPCLFKAGAEKICSLMHLKPIFKIDSDLLNIVPKGTIPYVCELMSFKTGEVLGEGRGSCSIEEKQNNSNVAIKIAQKRAQLDAVLRVSALSGQFTQDVEEMALEQSASTTRPHTSSATKPKTDADKTDPAIYCTFGKKANVKWAQMDKGSLDWYAGYFTKKLADNPDDKYKDSKIKALNAIELLLSQTEIVPEQTQQTDDDFDYGEPPF